MWRPNRHLLKFVVFLLICMGLLSSIVPAGAAGDSIDSITVTVPACSGLAGRMDVTFTTSGGTTWFTVDPGPGSSSIAGSGTFTLYGVQYLPNAPANSVIAVTAKLGTAPFSDDKASKTIHFNCTTGQIVNPPVAVDDSASTGTNTPVTINVAANDTDADGNLNPASAHSTVNPTHGTLVNHNDGTFTYTPNSGFDGTDGFDYEICDATSLCASAHVAIEVVNLPPDCSMASGNVTTIWPPNHRMVPVIITGATDPEGNPVTILVTSITSNEPENGTGDGDTAPDFSGVGTDQPMVRAERAGHGSGREYTISFTADDGNGGTCSGSVVINVPHDPGFSVVRSTTGGNNQPTATTNTASTSQGNSDTGKVTSTTAVNSSNGQQGNNGNNTIIITVVTDDNKGKGNGKGNGKG